MPIEMAGALRLGPRPTGSAAPTTLVEYLESIGKDSWYSIFEAGTGMFQNSNGTGSVASGDPVGCWVAAYQVGATFKFHQPTSGSRPTYSTTQYDQPTIYGNGSSHSLYTDSTTALNRELTVLAQFQTNNGTGMIWSQNSTQWALRMVATNSPPAFIEFGSNIEALALEDSDTVSASAYSMRGKATAGTGRRRAGFNSSARTARHGNAMYLFSSTGSSTFSAAGIRRLAIIEPRLTFVELATALQFMVS